LQQKTTEGSSLTTCTELDCRKLSKIAACSGLWGQFPAEKILR
jgi:hypothetical protein